MSQQRKLSRHNSRQSSLGETASVGSTKSVKSNGSGGDYNYTLATSATSTNQPNNNNNNKKTNGLSKQHGSLDSGDGDNSLPATNTLNVAEMLLHGVADNEIIDTWLKSVNCEELVTNFIEAGYDMPTISRITPQDLTAIGIKEPDKRLKILSEIKKLNLQDGIPNFKPVSLNHWLSLIKLDSYYYDLLCDQKVDTIEKLCQLTWEDFEELGITKLGHQKKLQLAIERLKSLDTETNTISNRPISVPIYDTNPNQVLAPPSSENHHSSIYGQMINKQPSTSELSSTGSGSMHSVYSANSNHYQPTYAPISISESQQTQLVNHKILSNQHHSSQQQVIYSQPPIIHQQQASQFMQATRIQHHHIHHQQPQQQSHYQPIRPPMPIRAGPVFYNGTPPEPCGMNGLAAQHNRQSVGQFPFNALAKLPLHQQQMLQQSSIYATLSRRPMKARQPPPVPIRTNSLKTNSLVDEPNGNRPEDVSKLRNNHASSTNSLYRPCNQNPMTSSSFTMAKSVLSSSCNATTGKDDDFPPPPSPLSMDTEEQDLVQNNECDMGLYFSRRINSVMPT